MTKITKTKGEKNVKTQSQRAIRGGGQSSLSSPGVNEGVGVTCHPERKRRISKAFTLAEVFLRHSDGQRRVAFTLAEVLITLGIIGVVAAMTMPTLVAKYKEQETVAKLSKFYNIVENAYQSMIAEYGTIDSWSLVGADDDDYYEKDNDGNIVLNDLGQNIKSDKANNSENLFLERFLKYIKVTKKCKSGDNSCRYYTKELYLDGSVKTEKLAIYPIVFADGSAIGGMWLGSSKCNMKYGTGKLLQNGCGDFYIMLKPYAETRTYGKDFFKFVITKYGIVPSGTPQFSGNVGNMKECLTGISWSDCTGWVIYNKNMDYLHCKDLSWNGKKKCK